MSFDPTITVYFLSDENGDEPPPDIASAYSYIRDHVPEDNIKWIKAIEAFQLIETETLTKKDVFVLEKFDGPLFDALQDTKSLVVGPRCLISCLLECSEIPPGNSPIFTIAMRGLHVSVSGLSVDEKDRVRNLITWMGGYYYQNMGRSITHLVANTIKSSKYELAANHDIPIMHTDWIYKVWERSSQENVRATDEEFAKYKLPVFYGANITCSGLDSDKKNQIMKLVNENGGIFNRAFRSQITDIVIIEKGNANSDKYKAAVSYKKDILIPEWIFDSVTKGYALSTKHYQVKNIKSSTPTKSDQSISDFHNDCTQLSEISRISMVETKKGDSTINESIMSMRPSANIHTGGNLISECCIADAKKAGTFLDGCCIYCCGFKAEDKEKLNRILNSGGATRYDEINDNITHIIVGQSSENDMKNWRKLGLLTTVHVVKLDWLLESIKQKQTVNELLYKVEITSSKEPDAPSPSSKRTLRSMNHSFKQPDLPKKRLDFNAKRPEISAPLASARNENEENELLLQYSQDQNDINVPVPVPVPVPTAMPSAKPPSAVPPTVPVMQHQPNTENESEFSNALSTLDYANLDFLNGLSVYIDRELFDDEFYSQMVYECESARGKVVNSNFRDEVDYAIVPFEKSVNPERFPIKAKRIVTELWVEDSIKENKQAAIQYFHRHIPHTADSKPLTGMIIVVSVYTGLERDFIDSLAELLGAKLNKSFVRKESPLLICPSPEGSKYEGAIKWHLPVVTSSWLVDCANLGTKLSFSDYLVGDSVSDFSIVERKNSAEKKGAKPVEKVTSIDSPVEKVAALNSPAPVAPVSNDFTPLRNKRVSELAYPNKRKNSPLESSESSSPHTPTNSTVPVPSIFENIDEFLAGIENEGERQCLRECILEMKANQTPELERVKRLACTPVNRRVSLPKGIPEFCTTPEFQKRMWEAFDRRWHLSVKKRKPDTPIEEVRRRVFKATFQKYGIEVDKNLITPKVDRSSSKYSASTSKGVNLIERMDIEESEQEPSPAVKRLNDFIKNYESRKSSVEKKRITDHPPTQDLGGALEQFDSEQLGGADAMVGWRDPSEFTISRRSIQSTMQYQGVPKFTISCSSDTIKMEIIEKVRRLRGEVCENLNGFDPQCTHLLAEKPNRGEKMLACIASGKWVLSTDYIDECSKAGCFLDEELFEWGNPKATTIESLPPDEQTIANAAHRWRKKLLESMSKNPGAFSGFRVILNIAERSKESIRNVLEAGCGEIVAAAPPYAECDQSLTATHCFVDVKKAPLKRTDHEFLALNGVRILSQMYINTYLMTGGDPDTTKYDLNL